MHDLPSLPADPAGQPDFRTLDLMQQPAWLLDPARRRMLHANPAALRLWGAASLAEFVARDISVVSEAVRIRTDAAMARICAGAVLQERITLYPNGQPVTVDALLSGVALPCGASAMLIEARVAAAPDAEVRALEALRHLPALVSLYDERGRVLFRNPAATAAHATTDRCQAGTSAFTASFTDPAAGQGLWDRAWACGAVTAEVEVRAGHGARWRRLDARRTSDPATGQPCLLVSEQDIQAEVAARAEIEHRATHDALTDLANRALFRRRLDEAAAAAAHGRPFSVLLLDLDRFKAVNDTLGHAAGDALLLEASQRMREVVRTTDTLARLGGDEFGLLLPGTGCRGAAAEMAAALVERVGAEYELEGTPVRIGASVGVALHDGAAGRGGAAGPEEMIRAADRALYGAKSAGRNTYRLAA